MVMIFSSLFTALSAEQSIWSRQFAGLDCMIDLTACQNSCPRRFHALYSTFRVMVKRASMSLCHFLLRFWRVASSLKSRHPTFCVYSYLHVRAYQTLRFSIVIFQLVKSKLLYRDKMPTSSTPFQTGLGLYLVFFKRYTNLLCGYLESTDFSKHTYIITHNVKIRYSMEVI